MQVHLEHTRSTCDHCATLTQGIILSAEFANQVNDSIQLCNECAKSFANRILESLGDSN